MGSKLSVSQVVSNLEARLAFHRQQEEPPGAARQGVLRGAVFERAEAEGV